MNNMNYRVLCFHGYEQTSESMKLKMKKVIEKFKGIDFEFAESLYDKKWYDLKDSKGIEENMIFINKFIKDKEYDGFIGFSQGAIFARILISTYKLNIKFLISLCGMDNEQYSIKTIEFPSYIKFYNVFGSKDTYVTPSESKYLTNFIKNVKEIEFDGKHIIHSESIINIIEEIY